MSKGRLEAFSDGVIAIIITIMVLELKVPDGTGWADLAPVLPKLSSYVLSFVFVGIYWNNHHHTLHTATRVDSRVLWANLHLLFWLSLIPFTTGWLGEHAFATAPVALYGAVLLMCAIAYTILTLSLIAGHGADSRLAKAIQSDGDLKGRASLVLYVTAIPLAFWNPVASCVLYVIVALLWLIPDPRIVRALAE